MTVDPQTEMRVAAAAEALAETHDTDALLVILGKQEAAIAATPSLAQDPWLDPPYDGTHMGLVDDLKDVGARIALRWLRSLHEVVCGKDASAKDRAALLSAIGVSEAAAIAVVTSMLLPLVSPALAAPIAVIAVRNFLIPAGEEICVFWGERLEEPLA